jgi:DNA-binding winged helix-turn-helix (wHTH) protein
MSPGATAYRFGRFRVDPREQRLTRDGEPIPITPRVFDTLVVFLRSPGRLLTKDALLASVWPDAAVEEANLTVNVSTLRRLLADDDAPACIETVPRRGYRFVRPVDVEEVEDVEHAGGGGKAGADRPSSARAQELYARANQAADETDHWETARDLYLACVEEAPDFAPAWARLARCHRVIAKFTPTRALREFSRARAVAAFEHALALDPSLPLTHSLYAQLEVDMGRAPETLARLLHLIERHGPNAMVLAALVHALRFCGLLEASRAAHDRARVLDPTVVTSVAHTCWLLGDYETALREATGDIGYMPGLALAAMGRDADAIAALRWRERDTRDNRARAFLISLRALVEGHRDESLAALQRAGDELADPEALFYIARTYARLDERDASLSALARAVEEGFFCVPGFTADPWLQRLRDDPRLSAIVRRAETRHHDAARTFAEAGGAAVLASD